MHLLRGFTDSGHVRLDGGVVGWAPDVKVYTAALEIGDSKKSIGWRDSAGEHGQREEDKMIQHVKVWG